MQLHLVKVTRVKKKKYIEETFVVSEIITKVWFTMLLWFLNYISFFFLFRILTWKSLSISMSKVSTSFLFFVVIAVILLSTSICRALYNCIKTVTFAVCTSVKCMASATIKTTKSNGRKVSRPQIELEYILIITEKNNNNNNETSFHARDAYID